MISDSLRARMEELCDTIQQISGINPRINSRKSDYVSVRSMVAQVLTDEGASESDVGELFGKNHATVAHYKKRMTLLQQLACLPISELIQTSQFPSTKRSAMLFRLTQMKRQIASSVCTLMRISMRIQYL